MISTLAKSLPTSLRARKRSLACSTPTMLSSEPRHSGMRVCGLCRISRTTASGASSALTERMLSRWTITSETSSSCRSSRPPTRSRSCLTDVNPRAAGLPGATQLLMRRTGGRDRGKFIAERAQDRPAECCREHGDGKDASRRDEACLSRHAKGSPSAEEEHLRRRHIFGDEGLTDAAGQDEGQRATRHFLVLRNVIKQRRGRASGRNIGDAPRQADAARCASTRAASSGLARLRRENRCARTMPMATPSPWTSRAQS